MNSAFQRARAHTVEVRGAPSQHTALAQLGQSGQRDLVRRYTAALKGHDLDSLLALLTEDATWSMPPIASWYRGHDAIARFLRGGPFTQRWQHVPVCANGQLAVACYTQTEPGGRFDAFGIDVLNVRDQQIAAVTAFLDPSYFATFGLPDNFSDHRDEFHSRLRSDSS